ncbi:MAG: RNA polymerase subunit sigma-24 [Clostridiales bacterium]|nr:RNA polymerase subunit sigma-24 [Clostridiales bacterium]
MKEEQKRKVVISFRKNVNKENKSIEIKEEEYDLCLNCNKKFKRNNRGRRKKYCSSKCRGEYYYKNGNTKTYRYRCEYCGKSFEGYCKARKYCSKECYVKDRFWREEEKIEFVRKVLNGEEIEELPKWLLKQKIKNKFS